MKELTIAEIMENAQVLHRKGKKWHFHMLTPDCMFNKKKGKHAFILENTSDKENYVVYSDKRYMEEGQQLVKTLHGNKIVDKSKGATSNKIIGTIIQRAKEMNNKNIPWHHHMLFPNCMFNKNSGKWNIVFEDKESNKILESVYDSEPTKDLRKIEVLYYKQKK